MPQPFLSADAKATLRRRILLLFRAHNPSQLNRISPLVDAATDAEATMRQLVESCGKPEPQYYPATAEERAALSERLRAFYGKYEPGKLSSVPTLVERYVDMPDELFEALAKKYNAPTMAQINAFKHTLRMELTARCPEMLHQMDHLAEEYVEDQDAFIQELHRRHPVVLSAEPASDTLAAVAPQPEGGSAPEADHSPPPSATSASPSAAPTPQAQPTAAPAAAETATPVAATTTASYRHRMVCMYSRYDPLKLSHIDDLLRKYAGMEDRMMAALVAKYGPEPDPSKWPDADAENRARARLERFFKQHNPEKLATIPKILAAYEGEYETLFQSLVAKYGPEPSSAVPTGAKGGEATVAEAGAPPPSTAAPGPDALPSRDSTVQTPEPISSASAPSRTMPAQQAVSSTTSSPVPSNASTGVPAHDAYDTADREPSSPPPVNPLVGIKENMGPAVDGAAAVQPSPSSKHRPTVERRVVTMAAPSATASTKASASGEPIPPPPQPQPQPPCEEDAVNRPSTSASSREASGDQAVPTAVSANPEPSPRTDETAAATEASTPKDATAAEGVATTQNGEGQGEAAPAAGGVSAAASTTTEAPPIPSPSAPEEAPRPDRHGTAASGGPPSSAPQLNDVRIVATADALPTEGHPPPDGASEGAAPHHDAPTVEVAPHATPPSGEHRIGTDNTPREEAAQERRPSDSPPPSAAHVPRDTTHRSTTESEEVDPPTTSEPTPPEPTAPESTTSEPTTPEPTAPEPTTPEPITPEPTAPESTMPEPTPPEPTPEAVPTVDEYHRRIERLFECYDPEKLPSLPTIFTKYSGMEAKLLAAVVQKYGREPMDEPAAGAHDEVVDGGDAMRTSKGEETEARAAADEEATTSSNQQMGVPSQDDAPSGVQEINEQGPQCHASEEVAGDQVSDATPAYVASPTATAVVDALGYIMQSMEGLLEMFFPDHNVRGILRLCLWRRFTSRAVPSKDTVEYEQEHGRIRRELTRHVKLVNVLVPTEGGYVGGADEGCEAAAHPLPRASAFAGRVLKFLLFDIAALQEGGTTTDCIARGARALWRWCPDEELSMDLICSLSGVMESHDVSERTMDPDARSKAVDAVVAAMEARVGPMPYPRSKERQLRFFLRVHDLECVAQELLVDQATGVHAVRSDGADAESNPPSASPRRTLDVLATSAWRERIVRLLRLHCPSRVATVDALLRGFRGEEAVLFNNLVHAYGPEPQAPATEHELLEIRKHLAWLYNAYQGDQGNTHGIVDDAPPEANSHDAPVARRIESIMDAFSGSEVKLKELLLRLPQPPTRAAVDGMPTACEDREDAVGETDASSSPTPDAEVADCRRAEEVPTFDLTPRMLLLISDEERVRSGLEMEVYNVGSTLRSTIRAQRDEATVMDWLRQTQEAQRRSVALHATYGF